MKRSSVFQFNGILYCMFIILPTTSSNFIITYAVESSSFSFSNNLSQLKSNHNMTDMMQRGNIAMGFDQNKISHEFSSTNDGGQIKISALYKDDNQTISEIRNHTRDIQKDFTEGNFTKPFYIHAQSVPGTDSMSKSKDQIQYQIQDVRNGSILLLITHNSSLIDSINEFMTYQSNEHIRH